MLVEGRMSDQGAGAEHDGDEEYAHIWNLMLESGGTMLDTRGDDLVIHCDDEEERDQLADDLRDAGIAFRIEADPDDEEACLFVIKRGFLAGDERAA